MEDFFEDDNLKFFHNTETCLSSNKIDVLLTSSSLQYLENPYFLIKTATDLNFDYIDYVFSIALSINYILERRL